MVVLQLLPSPVSSPILSYLHTLSHTKKHLIKSDWIKSKQILLNPAFRSTDETEKERKKANTTKNGYLFT